MVGFKIFSFSALTPFSGGPLCCAIYPTGTQLLPPLPPLLPRLPPLPATHHPPNQPTNHPSPILLPIPASIPPFSPVIPARFEPMASRALGNNARQRWCVCVTETETERREGMGGRERNYEVTVTEHTHTHTTPAKEG